MPRRRRRARATSDLRLAIECLPKHTKEAMLDGIRGSDIIVGAYVDGEGGVCPMLAAHRAGGRTDLLAFARAWDRFTGARGRSRRATRREVGVLVAHLEASLMGDVGADFGAAIADHHRLASRDHRGTPRRAPRSGDPDRHAELQQRPGWSWLRPFRRLDDYQRALVRAGASQGSPAPPEDEGPAPPRERQLA